MLETMVSHLSLESVFIRSKFADFKWRNLLCLTLLFIYLENGKNMKKINGIYILRLTNRCVQYLGISLYVSVTTIKRLTVKTP